MRLISFARNNIQNYLFQANPCKNVDSISKLVSDYLYETDNKDIVVFNKPPGFVYLGIKRLILN